MKEYTDIIMPSSPATVPTDPSSNRPSSPSNRPSSPSNNNTDPSSNTVNGDGYVVTTQQYADASGVEITHVHFATVDPTSDVQVTEDLSGNAFAYYDDSGDSAKSALIAQIQTYANDIQCSKFHGKGTIDDYSELFQAAAKIANESAQMQLDVDIEGFNQFASAADDLSALFNSFILKLENVSIIDDTAFLTAVANALKKISNLSKVFGKFKETILATSTVELPKSAHDAKVLLQNVVGQVNCAMTYITHFVDSSVAAPDAAKLSQEEQDIISGAVSTIDNWNILCDQGVSIAMANNPDIQYISGASNQLKQTAQTLSNATALLKSKLSAFNIPNIH